LISNPVAKLKLRLKSAVESNQCDRDGISQILLLKTYHVLWDIMLVLNNSCRDVGVLFYCSQCYQNITFFWLVFFLLRLKWLYWVSEAIIS